MYRLILMFLVIVAMTIFLGCSENNTTAPEINQNDQVPVSLAKAKPSANLIGTINCPFNYPPLPDPGGSELPIFWKGTIDFGEDIYGLYFISYDAPREYSQASPFYEEFVIHEENNEENVLMIGWNSGVVTNANNPPNDPSKFLANGKITEAYEPFEEWQDCNVHIRGLVYWIDVGFPEKAVATFRIN